MSVWVLSALQCSLWRLEMEAEVRDRALSVIRHTVVSLGYYSMIDPEWDIGQNAWRVTSCIGDLQELFGSKIGKARSRNFSAYQCNIAHGHTHFTQIFQAVWVQTMCNQQKGTTLHYQQHCNIWQALKWDIRARIYPCRAEELRSCRLQGETLRCCILRPKHQQHQHVPFVFMDMASL